MIWFIRHPRFLHLSMYSDDELEPRDHRRVNDHLAGCSRCRQIVLEIRQIDDIARSIPPEMLFEPDELEEYEQMVREMEAEAAAAAAMTEEPKAAAELHDRLLGEGDYEHDPKRIEELFERLIRDALARREAGERVLLPLNDPSPQRPRVWTGGVLAALLTLLVAGLVVSVRVLEADRPAFQLTPERPVAGEALTVQYRGGGLFADQTHLKLRARYRDALANDWQLLAGILVRGDDGVFRGEVALPDSVVYAAFAVEDLWARRVDSNNQELWDVLVHEDGIPTLDALWARAYDLEPRNWGAAYETTKLMTELYPDKPQSWAALFSFELGLFEPDSVFAVHRQRFHELERRYSESSNADPTQLARLARYALDLRETASAEYWHREAAARGAPIEVLAETEVLLIVTKLAADETALLSELERFWGAGGERTAVTAEIAIDLAIRSGNTDHIRTWATRFLSVRPHDASPPIRRMAKHPGLLSDAAAAAVAYLGSLDRLAEADRPLTLDKRRFDQHVTSRRQEGVVNLASIQLRQGKEALARSNARRAIPMAFDSEALLEASNILVQVGDTAAALEASARAAADVVKANTAAASIADLLAELYRERWSVAVEAARADMSDAVMRNAIVRYVDPAQITLWSDAGPTSLAAALQGRPAVVAFWSRYCAFALDEIQPLVALASGLREEGIELVVVGVDTEPEAAAYFGALGLNVSLLTDRAGDARAAFRSASTPDYFVLDDRGRVRFEHSSLEELPRQIEALRRTERMTRVAFAQ